jgi:hypothetical protein
MSTNSDSQHWHLFHKILFRFLFVFFFLEILTTVDFAVIGLGFSRAVGAWGQKTFTPPFLWLNNHVFHFYYNPYQLFTFSQTLILVRLIFFLIVTVAACAIWSIVDRNRSNYSKLDFWLRQFLCVCLSCVMWSYGIIKIFAVQMWSPNMASLLSPVGELTSFDLLWITLGYGTPYQVFTGIGEASGAILILFRRTRPLGLLILFAILTNVIVINYTYQVGVLGVSSFFLLITGYLLVPYLKNLWQFFFTDRFVNQFDSISRYGFTTVWKKYCIIVLAIVVIGVSYSVSFSTAYGRFKKTAAQNELCKYFEVKRFTLDGDTLNTRLAGDTVRWLFWEERVFNNEVAVTLYRMESQASKTYSLTKDSVNHTLTLKPAGGNDADTIRLTYHHLNEASLRLQGAIGGKNIVTDMEEIDLVSRFRLLNGKRHVFPIDPEEYF